MTILIQALVLFVLLGNYAPVIAAPAPFPAEFDPTTLATDKGRELRSAFAQQDYLHAVGRTRIIAIDDKYHNHCGM